MGCFSGVRLNGVRLCGLRGWGRGDLRTVVCEVCERGVAMDAGNAIGPEGVASLVPALEKMPRLTDLFLLGAPIDWFERAWSTGRLCVLGCFLGVRLDGV